MCWVQFFKHKNLIVHKYLPTYYRKKARARSLSKQRICTPTAIVRQIFTGTGKIENLTNFDNYFSYYTIINCHPDMRSKIGRYQYSTDKDIFHISPSERLIGRPLTQTPSISTACHLCVPPCPPSFLDTKMLKNSYFYQKFYVVPTCTYT